MAVTDGLFAAYNKQSEGSNWNDLTGNGNTIPLTNTSWESAGLQANANGEFGIFDNSSYQLNVNIGTIIMQFKSLSAFTDGLRRVLLGEASSSVFYRDFALTKNEGSTLFFYFREVTTTHLIGVNSNKVPNWLTGTQIAVAWDRENDIHGSNRMVLNIDGVHVTPDIALNTDSWGYHGVEPNTYILNNHANTSQHANGVSEYMYFFDVVKTEAELADIYADHSILLPGGGSEEQVANYSVPIFYR